MIGRILCRYGFHSWRWHDIPRDGVWGYLCRRCPAHREQELDGWS